MKYKLLLILLLAPAIVAATPLSRKDSVCIAALQQINAPCISWPTVAGTQALTVAIVRNVVAQSAQTVSSRLPAVEKLDTIIGNPSARSYALNSDFVRLNWVVKFSGDTAILPLNYVVVDSLFKASGGTYGLIPSYDDISKPRYAWQHNQQLFLAPIPQYPDTFVIAYFAVDKVLVNDTDTTLIMEDYRQIWLNFICSRLEAVAGDYQASAYYQGLLPPALREQK